MAGRCNSNGISINRNIVECKGKKKENDKTADEVLIETLWNVKTA